MSPGHLSVCREFERTSRDGRALTFEICPIPECMWDATVDFMLGNYIEEDVWWKAAGTAKDPEAIEEYRILLTSIVKLGMSVACFLTRGEGGGRTLVGANLCMPQVKDRFVDHVPPKSRAGLLSLRMFSEAMHVTAIYDSFAVDEYLMGAGLSVTPEYRRLGVATQLLRARMQLSKVLGYPVTGGIFTGLAAQRCAERAGMLCCYETPYQAFGTKCCVNFDTDTPSLKMYAARVE